MENLNELAAALAKAQGEIMPAPKDADNPFFKSKYASLPAVREAMREAFAKNGLSVVQVPAIIDGNLTLRTLLLHASGQSLDCGTLAAEVDLSNPQKAGSAITYFRRYALAAISQTVADEDDDGNGASGKKTAKLTAKEERYIADALTAIMAAASLEDLMVIGTAIKDQPPEVQNKLRSAYATRSRTLKDTADAPSDS